MRSSRKRGEFKFCLSMVHRSETFQWQLRYPESSIQLADSWYQDAGAVGFQRFAQVVPFSGWRCCAICIPQRSISLTTI